MKILVFDENVDINTISKAYIVLEIDEDRKGFFIKKHRVLNTNEHNHISSLKHILLTEG